MSPKSSLKRNRKSELSLVLQPGAFFQEEVRRAIHKQSLKTDQLTEFYLVDLLTRFMLTENFFAVDEKGNMREETLALLLGEALNSLDAVKKREDLRRLGDISLYTAGFFSDSLARKTVDVDYYIGMGKNAYSSLSQIGLDSHLRKMFYELANSFVRFVDVLAEVSAAAFPQDVKNILRTYEIWLRTRSERAEKQLKDAGIIPNANFKPELQ